MTVSFARVLLIEDNVVETRVMQAVLAKAGTPVGGGATQYDLTCAGSLADGLSRLTGGGFDVVLLDLSLPDTHGLETLLRLREQEPDIPVVILTGLDDEAVAVSAMQAGAQDYLVKGQMDGQLITRAIRYSIERHRLLRALSLTDELTGLYNRRGFLTLAEQHLKTAERTNKDCLLLYADLDGLKAINDTYGHSEGSNAILEAADALRETFRAADIIARLGGDEFTVLVSNVTDNTSEVVAARLQKKIDARNALSTRPYALSISLGFARYGWATPVALETLMEQADQMMYQHKRARKRQVAHV